MHKNPLTFLCAALYLGCQGAGVSRQQFSFAQQSGKDSIMIKVEDIQQYGKEQYETAVASATTVQQGLQAIASAYGDYTKKSFEDTKSFVEKLSGVKSLDKALEVQTEYAKSAYETFVAESQKIAGLYTDLAKQTFKPLEGMVAKFTPAAAA
jgi:phasin family protein